MYSFNNDYSEGAHPKILEAMINANLIQKKPDTDWMTTAAVPAPSSDRKSAEKMQMFILL